MVQHLELSFQDLDDQASVQEFTEVVGVHPRARVKRDYLSGAPQSVGAVRV